MTDTLRYQLSVVITAPASIQFRINAATTPKSHRPVAAVACKIRITILVVRGWMSGLVEGTTTHAEGEAISFCGKRQRRSELNPVSLKTYGYRVFN